MIVVILGIGSTNLKHIHAVLARVVRGNCISLKAKISVLIGGNDRAGSHVPGSDDDPWISAGIPWLAGDPPMVNCVWIKV